MHHISKLNKGLPEEQRTYSKSFVGEQNIPTIIMDII